jgi:23S rRNA pseudouridine2604 synthase
MNKRPRNNSPRPRTAFAARTSSARPDVRASKSLASASVRGAKPVTRAVRRATNAVARAHNLLDKNGAIPQEKVASEWPMRINKYLAQKGYATRKAADELVAKRRVLINGRPAVLGDKVEKTDQVEVRIDKSKPQKELVYFAFNKPRSIVTNHTGGKSKGTGSDAKNGDKNSDTSGDRDILALVPELEKEYGVFPIGRLDKDSHGLIIPTNDGRVTDRLLSPARDHEKEYAVMTKLKLRESFKTHMEEGVNIEGYLTKPAKVRLTGANSFRITITEGKKHQIRRMVVALFNEVRDLQRVRILNIELGKLASGTYRSIKDEELATFLKSLGL